MAISNPARFQHVINKQSTEHIKTHEFTSASFTEFTHIDHTTTLRQSWKLGVLLLFSLQLGYPTRTPIKQALPPITFCCVKVTLSPSYLSEVRTGLVLKTYKDGRIKERCFTAPQQSRSPCADITFE